jgi:hypothetical protein
MTGTGSKTALSRNMYYLPALTRTPATPRLTVMRIVEALLPVHQHQGRTHPTKLLGVILRFDPWPDRERLAAPMGRRK